MPSCRCHGPAVFPTPLPGEISSHSSCQILYYLCFQTFYPKNVGPLRVSVYPPIIASAEGREARPGNASVCPPPDPELQGQAGGLGARATAPWVVQATKHCQRSPSSGSARPRQKPASGVLPCEPPEYQGGLLNPLSPHILSIAGATHVLTIPTRLPSDSHFDSTSLV